MECRSRIPPFLSIPPPPRKKTPNKQTKKTAGQSKYEISKIFNRYAISWTKFSSSMSSGEQKLSASMPSAWQNLQQECHQADSHQQVCCQLDKVFNKDFIEWTKSQTLYHYFDYVISRTVFDRGVISWTVFNRYVSAGQTSIWSSTGIFQWNSLQQVSHHLDSLQKLWHQLDRVFGRLSSGVKVFQQVHHQLDKVFNRCVISWTVSKRSTFNR